MKQNNEIQAVNWKYMPSMDTLSQYLYGDSLQELSKCCKRYRKQLESRVLEELDLDIWFLNNRERYDEESWEFKNALEFLKNDLGSKLKFVKKFILDCHVDDEFAEIFIKLLPNIKSLDIYQDYTCNDYLIINGLGIITILKGLEHLEHVNFLHAYQAFEGYITNIHIFPKSLKSFYTIDYEVGYETNDYIHIYETIDASYINLYSITIVSNRMLQNLSSRMPNLQEVKIDRIYNLDTSKLVAFLKANTQIRKLTTYYLKRCNLEILKIILSSKYLEEWNFSGWHWEEIEFNSLPSNYSIKNLETSNGIQETLILQLINSCKSLETLDIWVSSFEKLDLLKLERNINILKLSTSELTPNCVKKIDSSRLINQVYLDSNYDIEKIIEDCNIDKLKNYKLIHSISGRYVIKLIN